MDWFLERLKEPSTWRGLTGLLAAVGVVVSPDLIAQIGAAVVAILGVIEVARKEKK